MTVGDLRTGTVKALYEALVASGRINASLVVTDEAAVERRGMVKDVLERAATLGEDLRVVFVAEGTDAPAPAAGLVTVTAAAQGGGFSSPPRFGSFFPYVPTLTTHPKRRQARPSKANQERVQG